MTPITRRDFLTRASAAGASVVLLPAMMSFAGNGRAAEGTASEEIASGVVFEDAHGRGARSAENKGIEGVLVSNGRDVVRTDRDGKYRLAVRDGDMVFVIKPAQYMTPVNKFNLCKFYYFHRPTGSPQWKPTDPKLLERLDPQFYFPGSKPTGPLPTSIDFPLIPRQEPDEFKVLVFGDTQVSHDRQVEWMSRDTIAELIKCPDVAFGLSLGDLVNVGLLYMFEPLNELQVKTGFPWYVIPGNHDQNLVTPNDELADETFRSIYGPTMYAFDYGPVSFLMLENIMRNPFTALADEKVASDAGDKPATNSSANAAEKPAGKTAHPAGDDYKCGLRDDQWQFVENYLETVPTDRQLVICMHIPITGPSDEEKAFGRRFLKLISGRNYTLSMSGHTHIQHHTFHSAADGFSGPSGSVGEHHHFNSICVRGDGYRGMFDELRIPGCMAVDGTPNGYSFISFTKTGYSIRYKAARSPDDYQMNIYVSPRVRKKYIANEMVKANIFAGSEKSTVRMRISDGEWLPMALTPQPDPAMTWVLEAQNKPESWLGSKYHRDEIPDSNHIWEAPVPPTLHVGTHTLEVEAKDMFGRVDRSTTLFRVVNQPTSESLRNA